MWRHDYYYSWRHILDQWKLLNGLQKQHTGVATPLGYEWWRAPNLGKVQLVHQMKLCKGLPGHSWHLFFKQELRGQEDLQTASQAWKRSAIPSKIRNGIPKIWASQTPTVILSWSDWVRDGFSPSKPSQPRLIYLPIIVRNNYKMFILLWFLSGICRKLNFVGNNPILFKEIWAPTNATTFSK